MTIKYLDKYPKNLAKSLWVVKPSWTVFKLFCKTVAHRPVTVLYPYEKEWVPDNYRGRPGLRFDKCVGCGGQHGQVRHVRILRRVLSCGRHDRHARVRDRRVH